ncbi:Mov34/MPN/PAD-1 family protein [Brevibacillus borstelensis]|uniref:Mov34/MPN/PAD-1 family protein n=1 Tax=Brevibacillus borstelensis TaxID=45462 RepID=UPI0030C4D7A1
MASLYLTPKVWRQIEQAVRKNPNLETGGVLMGYPLSKEEWLVTYASGPGPKAIHQPHSIMFDDQHLRNLVRKQSRRRQWQYIGDWHSHTVRRLTPSKGDRRTIWEKASKSVYMSASPFMLIVGLNKRDQLQGRAFTLGDALNEVKNLKVIDRQFLQQRL